MLHILGRFFVVTEFFATTFYFTNRPRNLSYELPDETSSLLAPNVSTRKLCSSHDASGVHDNSSFVKRDVGSCNALCADVVLSSSTTSSKGLCEHVPRILSARSCVLVGVFFANSSDKLSVPQPGSHVTTGGLSIEHVEEISRFQFGSLNQFDWFKVFIVGFITGSLELRIESLRLFFQSVPAEVVVAKTSIEESSLQWGPFGTRAERKRKFTSYVLNTNGSWRGQPAPSCVRCSGPR